MTAATRICRSLLRCEQGATAIEYVFLIAFMALAIIVAGQAMGQEVVNLNMKVVTAWQNAAKN